MYVETDFFLALIKDDDWLGEAAEAVFERHRESLWTSEYTLIELLLLAYREGLDAHEVVNDASSLVSVDGPVDHLLTASVYVDEFDLTPFDALHAVAARGDTIVSSDRAYEPIVTWVDLRSFDGSAR